jgi:hypothetical protein
MKLFKFNKKEIKKIKDIKFLTQIYHNVIKKREYKINIFLDQLRVLYYDNFEFLQTAIKQKDILEDFNLIYTKISSYGSAREKFKYRFKKRHNLVVYSKTNNFIRYNRNKNIVSIIKRIELLDVIESAVKHYKDSVILIKRDAFIYNCKKEEIIDFIKLQRGLIFSDNELCNKVVKLAEAFKKS